MSLIYDSLKSLERNRQQLEEKSDWQPPQHAGSQKSLRFQLRKLLVRSAVAAAVILTIGGVVVFVAQMDNAELKFTHLLQKITDIEIKEAEPALPEPSPEQFVSDAAKPIKNTDAALAVPVVEKKLPESETVPVQTVKEAETKIASVKQTAESRIITPPAKIRAVKSKEKYVVVSQEKAVSAVSEKVAEKQKPFSIAASTGMAAKEDVAAGGQKQLQPEQQKGDAVSGQPLRQEKPEGYKNPRKRQELLQSLRVRMQQGKKQEVEEMLLQLKNELGDDSPVSLRMHAYWFLLNKEYIKAKEQYNRLLFRQPDDLTANTNLALIHYRIGDRDGAIDRLSRMRTLYPEDKTVRSYLMKMEPVQ